MTAREKQNLFPGFVHAFDIQKIQAFLNETFREKDIQVDSCTLSDVNFEPGRHCVLLYRLSIGNSRSALFREQLVLGKVLMRGESAEHLQKHAIHASCLGMVFYPFPHDPAMTWLSEACEKASILPKLKRILAKNRWSIKNLTITLLAYTPRMRATFLYDIKGIDRNTGEQKNQKWIAKTNFHKHPHSSFANYWALWQASNHLIAMPKPLGFLLDPPLTFQEQVQGIRLGAIVDDPQFDILMRKTARSLASFHQLKIPLCNTRPLEKEIRTLTRWSNVLVGLLPDRKHQIECLKKGIGNELENRFRIEGPVHADFHHTNILVDGTHVQLIDMDEMALGCSALDAGRFLSSLRIPSLRKFGSFDGLKDQRELFLVEYLKHSSKQARDVKLFESASLLTSSAAAFRLQRPNWEQEIPSLLDEAEKMYKEAITAKPVSITTAHYQIDRMRWAKDENYVRALLAPTFLQEGMGELTECRLQKEDDKERYLRLLFKVSAWNGTGKLKVKLDLLLHRDKERRSLYDYCMKINQEFFNYGKQILLPKPFAYLPELGATAYYRQEGTPLSQLMGKEESFHAVDSLAEGLAFLHQIKTPSKGDNSYVLLHPSPHKIKFSNGSVFVTHPIRKLTAHPYLDIGNLSAKLILFGITQNRLNEAKDLTSRFQLSYSKYSGANPVELAAFEAQALSELQ